MNISTNERGYGEKDVRLKPEQALANAIVRLATYDYRKALSRLKKDTNNRAAQRRAADCESFFMSQWFGELTRLDGYYLMNRLREEQNYDPT